MIESVFSDFSFVRRRFHGIDRSSSWMFSKTPKLVALLSIWEIFAADRHDTCVSHWSRSFTLPCVQVSLCRCSATAWEVVDSIRGHCTLNGFKAHVVKLRSNGGGISEEARLVIKVKACNSVCNTFRVVLSYDHRIWRGRTIECEVRKSESIANTALSFVVSKPINRQNSLLLK